MLVQALPECPVWTCGFLEAEICAKYTNEGILINDGGCSGRFCYVSGVKSWYSLKPDDEETYPCADFASKSTFDVNDQR
jgi:hypothetical protein